MLRGLAGLRSCFELRLGWLEGRFGVDSLDGWAIKPKSSGIPAVEEARCIGRENREDKAVEKY